MPQKTEAIIYSSAVGYSGAKATSGIGLMSLNLFEILPGVSVTLSDIGQLVMIGIGIATFVMKYRKNKRIQREKKKAQSCTTD